MQSNWPSFEALLRVNDSLTMFGRCLPAYPEHPMTSILPVPSPTPPVVSKPAANLSQAPAASSSLFGNLIRKTEVAMGLKSQTGFTSGATYDTQTIAGQTKSTLNSAVNATKSLLHIK
jgi:hypothetical protein